MKTEKEKIIKQVMDIIDREINITEQARESPCCSYSSDDERRAWLMSLLNERVKAIEELKSKIGELATK